MSGGPESAPPRRRRLAILDAGIVLAGGDPAVVRPLTRGLLRASDGRLELLWRYSAFPIHPQGLRALLVVVAALFSVVLVGLMIMMGPRLGAAIHLVVFIHWIAMIMTALTQSGPALLGDDDAAVGWWPISRRDLLLARLGALLRPMLEVGAGLMAIPLVAYAIAGRPPLAAALLLAAGLLLQTVGTALALALLLQAVVRLAGPRHARRLGALLADGGPAVAFLVWMGILSRLEWLLENGERTAALIAPLLPPAWFAAWGLPLAGSRSLLMAGLGLGATLALAALGFRLLASRAATAEPLEPVATTPPRRHWSGLVAGALIPWTSGREGWVTRRLLEHHLREDWRFVGTLLMEPVMFGFLIFLPLFSAHVDREATGLLSGAFPMIFAIWTPWAAIFMQYSSRPQAMWLVATGDFEPDRMLAAQRGVVRGMILAPMLALYAARLATLDVAAWVIAADALFLLAYWEIVVTLVQTRQRSLPFCLPFNGDRLGDRVASMLTGMVAALLFLVLAALYTSDLTGRIAAAALLSLAWRLAHLHQRRRLRGTRLRIGVVGAAG